MFLINPLFALLSFTVIVTFYFIQVKRELKAPWGDIRSALFNSISEWAAKTSLKMPQTAKSWKPNLMIPVEEPKNWNCLIGFIKDIRDRKITHIDLDRLFELMYQVSEDAYKIFSKKSDTVEKTIHHRLFFNTLQSGLKDNNKYGLLAKFVNYYIEKASELNYFQDSKFEYQFALDKNLNACGINSDDIFIKGVIDRVDILKSVVNVIDYKSKKMISNLDSEKIKQIRELKDVQLALYILYVKQQFTDKNYYASLLSFKGDKPYYHFANLSNENIKDYELYSDNYEEELKNLIFTTRDNIQNGKFGFNDSDDKVCGYCDFCFAYLSFQSNK